MPYAIQELVIRQVSPLGTGQITGLGAAAMWDGPVARRLTPDPVARRGTTPRRNRDLCLRHGYQVRSVIRLPDGPPLDVEGADAVTHN
jgi:hypothetical protein